MTGFLFLQFGMMKVFHWPVGDHAMPPFSLMTQIGWAGLLELVGGFLIIVGLWTRPVAFLLSGEMAVAYFQVHAPRSFFPAINDGHPAVIFCFIYLYLAFAGGGRWSLDNWIAKQKSFRVSLKKRIGNKKS